MSWTDERIDTLRKMWEGGQTASQIAEALGGVSRNAVIGKAHRLGLQSRPSPVVPKDTSEKTEPAVAAASPPPTPKPTPAPAPVAAAPVAAPEPAPVAAPAPAVEAQDEEPEERAAPVFTREPNAINFTTSLAPERSVDSMRMVRSVGPGGFVRQSPGEQQPPLTPAPPRRLVPAKPSPEMAGKTSLLELSDKVCKWPLGHPGEADFHFCGDKVNPGFPYCVAHCGHAYQAQLPRRDRRAAPLPFGGPRAR